MNYRDAEVAREVSVREITAPVIFTGKVGATAGKRRRIAAIDDGYSRRVGGISGDVIKSRCVSENSVFVREVQELLNNEMVSAVATLIRIQRMVLFS